MENNKTGQVLRESHREYHATPVAVPQQTMEQPVRVVTLGPQGRLVVPAPLREAMGLKEGDQLVTGIEDGRLVMETRANVLRRLQEHLKATAPPGASLVDELIADRREEARTEREEAEAEIRAHGRDPGEVFAKMEADSRKMLEDRFGKPALAKSPVLKGDARR